MNLELLGEDARSGSDKLCLSQSVICYLVPGHTGHTGIAFGILSSLPTLSEKCGTAQTALFYMYLLVMYLKTVANGLHNNSS